MNELLRFFPELSLELSLTNRFVDLIEEGMDLGDPDRLARRLAPGGAPAVHEPAHPGGVAELPGARGTPETVEDLSQHQCVLFTSFTRANEWKLMGPEGPVNVSINGRVASNNVETLTLAAKQGLGITVGATLSVGPALLAGDLVRVLPAYQFEQTAVYAVYPSARQLSTKTRAAVDYLASKLSDPPSWDQVLAGKVPGF